MTSPVRFLVCVTTLYFLHVHPASLLHAQVPSLINYQGRLVDGTNLVNGNVGLSLRLYDASAGGAMLYADSNTVTVVDGLYATYLGDGTIAGALEAAFTNAQVWLEVVVNGAVLTPRERIVSVPYARVAQGLRVVQTNNIVLNPEAGANIIQPGVSYATIGGGVNHTIGGISDYATIGGGLANRISTNVTGATISGGAFNRISTNALYATIAGGSVNDIGAFSSHSAIGGGNQNSIDQNTEHSIIGGGRNNIMMAGASYSVIGGGWLNSVSNLAAYSIVAGGYQNVALLNAQYGTIGGGQGNRLVGSSMYATVPGGRNNMAASYAFAAGRRAQALHAGSFVWGDSTDADIQTTADNQFLVRAGGGLGVNVPSIGADVTADFGGRMRVRGNTAGLWVYDTTVSSDRGFVGLESANQIGFYGHHGAGWGLVMSVSNGFVGIGTTTPTNRLHVNGTVQATAYITTSDRNAKENILPVSPNEILEKVVGLPISTWTFRDEPNGTHIGPMAQDFHAAFGLGNTDTGIMTVDADGVALAAIQALAKEKERMEERVTVFGVQVSELEAENRALREELDAIKRKLGI